MIAVSRCIYMPPAPIGEPSRELRVMLHSTYSGHLEETGCPDDVELHEVEARQRAMARLRQGAGLCGGGLWDDITGGISNAFNAVTHIPVLGHAVDFLTTPFQAAANAIDTGVRAAGDVVSGDFEGAKSRVLGAVSDAVNAPSAIEKLTAGTPLEGLAASATQLVGDNVNIGGMSVNDAKGLANAALAGAT